MIAAGTIREQEDWLRFGGDDVEGSFAAVLGIEEGIEGAAVDFGEAEVSGPLGVRRHFLTVTTAHDAGGAPCALRFCSLMMAPGA